MATIPTTMDYLNTQLGERLIADSGGSVSVEALSVTENGTYTAPAGKAYSPVTVNVSGGGSAVTVISEQQFTGEYNEGVYFAILDAEPFGDVTLNVTYDDNTYEQLRGTEAEGIYFYGGYDPETGVDFSVYPFLIISEQEVVSIVTDNGNTHTVSATAEQRSLSTADVTFSALTYGYRVIAPIVDNDVVQIKNVQISTVEPTVVKIPMGSKGAFIDDFENVDYNEPPQISGDIDNSESDFWFQITGNGTITLKGEYED